MYFFSVIIPLYNRPQEIKELLASLVTQSYTNFEVIIVEDGSSNRAEKLIESFQDQLNVRYFYKENEGQGFARNFGFAHAQGNYFIVFDSDILVPSDYFEKVIAGLNEHHWDAFGGPDAAHESFTSIQKAISYSMTSPFTTGGIRGNKKHVGQFHPRSFNMGISRKVYEETNGFLLSRQSEDIEFSIRMIQQNFKVGLIPDAFVYHKRRANFQQFFWQTYRFGKGRIEIYKLFPSELKWVHALPSVFVICFFALLGINAINLLTFNDIDFLHKLAWLGNSLFFLYVVLLFLHALVKTKSLYVALLSIVASFTQLFAYGFGFLRNYLDSFILNKKSK
ncbi:glycosyltransferase [Sphingobacterium hungaricum]|uniref:Glycosyltransferase n=1 Tax=Sphingobacterium hungaricum TaxID=2082723 RepID=A0A928UXJ1_9SPHI|nr:glycosyltransferase [Sphingobacterium hungaricum]MBE8712414.1 glycosyltransferase [Sphingobacterium hungaricum]